MSNIRKTKKCCKHPKTSFTRANIRYVKHPKNQKVLQTSENQLNQGKHQICRTSEKTKSAANIQKPALPWQTSDMSNNRKTKNCCKKAKTSLTRANIRYFEHPKNEKVMQISENQLYQGEHPICQTSEKPKSAANIRRPALPGQTLDMSNIRKTKKVLQTSENQLNQGKHQICRTSEKTKSAANIQKPALPWQTSDMSNNRKTKKCCKKAKTSLTRANIRYFEHPKNEKVMQISENQLYQGEHPICQTSEKPKSAANMRKPALPGQTLDMSNIRKTKKCCKKAKTSLTRANIRYVKHPKNRKMLQTSENHLTRANISYVEHPKNQKVLQTSEDHFIMANIRYAKHPKNQKVLQISEKQLFQGKNPIWQTSEKNQKCCIHGKNQLYQGKHQTYRTSEKPKSAANIRKPALPGRTSEMSNIRKTKKCCKHAKTSLTRANIRYVKHPKNQKMLQTSENHLTRANISYVKHPKNEKVLQLSANQLYRGEHAICQHPKNQKVLQTSENQLYQGKHQICQTSEKPKSAANIRKPACQTSSGKHSRANIRYVKHPKNQKVLQTSENQLNQGKHQICQTSEKPKSAANIRRPALPGQTLDMSNIRKTKKRCKQAKTSLTRANIRYVEHPKNQKVLQTSKNQLYHGKHPICQTSEKPKMLHTWEKPALPGQTSDISNIRKTKKCCKHPKTSFTRANIRYVKHPKNQKVLQTCENQLNQGKH